MEHLNHRTSTLIHGCDTISRKLRYCLNPIGLLFKFDPNSPHRPKPLALTVVLVICSSIVTMIMFEMFLVSKLQHTSTLLNTAKGSIFVSRLMRFYNLYNMCIFIATPLILIVQHGSIANVMAINNNFVSKREQFICARNSVLVFVSKVAVNTLPVFAVFAVSIKQDEDARKVFQQAIVSTITLIFLNVSLYAPVMYTCYLGASLGKHVENFSKLYIDTMFDQYMKAIEQDDSSSNSNQPSILDFSDDIGSDKSKSCMRYICCCGCMCTIFRFLRRVFIIVYIKIRELAAHLNSHKYPELPEMKMTKLSTTGNLKMSDAARAANSHLIRIRLRRTQIMLSELRDVVTDINKMSSPIILMNIIYESLRVLLVTTLSVHGKFYRSFNLLIIPTVASTISLTVCAAYICICLDMPISELKLMVNKLFDFIIMNHRIQPQGNNKMTLGLIGSEDSRLLAMAAEREREALSETWSQFQYTRKLANTIQFTMGGILPVTRRLLLPVLGHILSAVFISIEIMSIIDTSV